MSIDYDQEFEELKDEYLLHIEDLIEQLQSILGHNELDSEKFKEIFRIVHSIKGGAASHEITQISLTSHHFEDFLVNKLSKNLSNTEHRESCLKFVSILEDIGSKLKAKEEVHFNQYLDEISNIHISDMESAKNYKGNILVVDNTSTMGNLVKNSLQQMGYHCTLSNNGLTAFNRLVTQKFDAVISSMNLNQLDGISLISALKATNNINADIPVLITSASKNVLERFPKDIRPNKVVFKDENFIAHIEQALSETFDKSAGSQNEGIGPKRVLYVEDDPKMQKLMQLSLKKIPHVTLSLAHDLESAIEKVNESKPDIILLDNFLKNTSGEEVFYKLLEESIPTLFLTASESSVPVKKLTKHGEFLGIITKPFRPGAIYGQIKRFYNDK